MEKKIATFLAKGMKGGREWFLRLCMETFLSAFCVTTCFVEK